MSESSAPLHDLLFSGSHPELTATDPELSEILGNFIDAEVPANCQLDRRTRLMAQLAGLLACGALTEYRALLDAALTAGVTPVEAKEIVYQAIPYIGAGRALDYLRASNEILADRGIELPLPGQSTTTRETREGMGRAVREEITGAERTAAMYDAAGADERHYQRFLSANCFGDYLTRGGIDIPTRELLTFAMLTALGGADRQVKAHASANLNIGNTRQQLLDVITVLLPFVGYPRSLTALAAVNELTRP